jgi:Uncharacterised nucleotidyltransferase
MTPHVELLLQCARRNPGAGAIRSLAQSSLDWPAFVSIAETHDLQSLCFWLLQRFCPEAIPSEIFAHLRRHFRRNTDRNLFMTAELFRIIETLSRGGIPAAAFKGPVFAWSLYETPGVREYLDLDLLVHAADVYRARQLLRELGYRSETEAQFFQYGGQLELIRGAPSVVLDLHWDLAPRSMGLALAAEALWPRLIEVPIAGRAVLTFDPHDQLMLSAMHGGKHGWTTLAWLADIDALIETHRLDWDRVLANARSNRLSRALFLGLRLASDLLETQLPAEVMQKVCADSAATVLAQEAKTYLIERPADQPLIPRKLVYQLRLTEGWLQQSRLLWINLSKPNVADSESLNIRPGFFWLYYAARPFRLAVKYVRLLAGRLGKAVARGFGG